jgi:heat shock protein HslJ
VSKPAAIFNALLAALLAGCTSMTPAADPAPLDGTAWVLASLPGRTLGAGQPATLSFEGGRAQGSDGCNRYWAPYTAPAATRRMCADEGVMAQEQQYLKALESVAAVRFEGNRLELRRADGALALSAQREGG